MPEGGAEGVLVAFASFIGGFALWVDEHELFNHAYQVLGSDVPADVGEADPDRRRHAQDASEIDERKPGAGGTVALWANEEQIGEGRMPWSIPMIFTTYAGLDIGRNGGGVDLAYEDKFRTRSRNREERGLRLKLAATYEAEKALHSTWPT